MKNKERKNERRTTATRLRGLEGPRDHATATTIKPSPPGNDARGLRRRGNEGELKEEGGKKE
jgi:hypothetical protein